MVWKHIKETLTDPSVWRDVSKDLIKDAIRWLVRGIFVVVLGLWLGSKINPDVAKAWDQITGAFGPAWQALWRPLGVPRIIALATLAAVVAPPLIRWWRAWLRRREPHKTVVQVVEAGPDPPPQPPLTGDDLNANQKKLLAMLWRIYPESIEFRVLLQNFELTYPALERLAESLERHGLVTITPAYDHVVHSRGALVALTKPGRDFCHDNGLSGDQSASAAPASPPRLGPPPTAPLSELEDALLTVLAGEHPDSVELRDLPARLKRTSLAAEQVADDLEGRGLVKVNRVVGYGSTSSGSVALTPAGRKLCIEKGLT